MLKFRTPDPAQCSAGAWPRSGSGRTSERLTVDQLAQISALLGFTMAELLQESASSTPRLHTLSAAQESQLVSDVKLLLVAVCPCNHWTLDEIVAAYRLSRAECLKRLLALDRLGVIERLPGDRIRLLGARDFGWLPGGPIHRYYKDQGLHDFLEGDPDLSEQALDFAFGILTAAAQADLQQELRRLRAKVTALHDESAAAPLNQRRGTSVLLAMRDWEPAGFRDLRR